MLRWRTYFLCLATALAGGAFAQTPADAAFVERTALSAADQACDLFSEMERHALLSGRLQAGNALLRGGFSRAEVDSIAAEAERYGRSQTCDDERLLASVDNVKLAFEAYLGTIAQDFPGLTTTWHASRSKWDRWRVVQKLQENGLQAEFGLLAPPPEDAETQTDYPLAMIVAVPEGDLPPSTARLFLRDADRIQDPWLGNILNYTPGPAPRTLTEGFWAADRTVIEDEDSSERAVLFIMPDDALDALSRLDPREFVEVELTPSARASARTPTRLTIEVGDLAAASAFVALPAL